MVGSTWSWRRGGAAAVMAAAVLATAPSAISATALSSMAISSELIDGVFQYGFSECINNERTLFYYTDDEQTCAPDANGEVAPVIAKPPVPGLRCDVVCDKGYFLGANFTDPNAPVSACEKCPHGKYSLGGGKLYSQRTDAWSPLSVDFHSECVTRNLYTSEWHKNCDPWKPSKDGSMIISGANSDILGRYQASRLFASLRLSATFVRNGTITFRFRVDAEPPYDGLVFGMDEETVMPLMSHTDGWQEAVFNVAAGAHAFSWDYTKDFSGDSGADQAALQVIELVGTSYSDSYCQPCGSDVTMSGGSLCAFCKANEYAAPRSDSELDYACYQCPTDTFAPRGSIGLDACVEQRACSADDMVEKFTPCVDGKRNVTFAWSKPKTCDESLPGSRSLPSKKVDAVCKSCSRGYRQSEDDDGSCEPCPSGTRYVSNPAVGTVGSCAKCSSNKVVINELEFGRSTQAGWSVWPSIIDVEAAKRHGWKLTRDGLVFSAPRRKASSTSEVSSADAPALRFPLPFNATFKHSGSIQIMYVLQNVPTFESAGTRAWLELEVVDVPSGTAASKKPMIIKTDLEEDGKIQDDDVLDAVGGDAAKSERIIHLANGSVNGTSTEEIQLNLTAGVERSTKWFELVLRAQDRLAARMVHAKLMYIRLMGTEDGPGVTCGHCPAGTQVVDSEEFSGCQMCTPGTFASISNGQTSCEACPVNTTSVAGATECSPCGDNTMSDRGSGLCAAPSLLKNFDAPTSASSVTTNETETIDVKPVYNLVQLQELMKDTETFMLENDGYFEDYYEDPSVAESNPSLGTASMIPVQTFKVGENSAIVLGLFQPVSRQWDDVVAGQIVDDRVGTDDDGPYVVHLNQLNAKDAGGIFEQGSALYGHVQCSIPAQWRATSGGERMAIKPYSNGTGLTVEYTEGSPCKSGGRASTTVRFICDLNAVFDLSMRPKTASRDSKKCHVDVEWRTPFACPMCQPNYFSESKSACNGGVQSTNFEQSVPCYGGARPDAVPISTCTDVVLDTKALYTVYAFIAVIAGIVVLMLAALLIVHRKYRNVYHDYMYLKGKTNVTEEMGENGTNESTFEFSPKSTTIDGLSPAPTGMTDDTHLQSPQRRATRNAAQREEKKKDGDTDDDYDEIEITSI